MPCGGFDIVDVAVLYFLFEKEDISVECTEFLFYKIGGEFLCLQYF